MVKALRNGVMLLTLLLVIISGMGLISVCPCHEEVFFFSCSCQPETTSCDCCGTHTPDNNLSSPQVGHFCQHQQLEIGELAIPIFQTHLPSLCITWHPIPGFCFLIRHLPITNQATNSAIPDPPDILWQTGSLHEGFHLPLLI